MSTPFVTKPGAPAPEAEPVIATDAFWPSIDPAKIRAAQRVPDAVTAPRLRNAIISAITATLRDLRAWKTAQLAIDITALQDVPADQIDGKSDKVQAWYRAIGCRAKAELVERNRDIDTTHAGDRAADALDPSVDELRRDAAHAVRDILGRGRTCVELI